MTDRRDVWLPVALWSERQLPASTLSMLDGRGVFVGSAETSPEDPFAHISGASAIIASARIQYDESVMQRAPGLRVISRTGTGTDNIDLAAATDRGVVVCNIPDGPTISTAEHTLALLMAVAKRLKPAERALQAGRFDLFNDHDAMELKGRVLGIVGLGAIGRLVAGFGSALGMRVIAFDPHINDGVANSLRVECCPTLSALLGQADIVSLHAPLTKETGRMIDTAAIAAMRPGAILINTARGGLVDELALAAALDRGHISGVGIDVFDPEPPAADNPLVGRPNVVATPHVAAATVAGRERLWASALSQVFQVFAGEIPDGIVNPDVVQVITPLT